jgi:heat shock protein HslJ
MNEIKSLRDRYYVFATLFLVALVFATACGGPIADRSEEIAAGTAVATEKPRETGADPTTTAEPAALTEEDIRNAAYQLEDLGAIQLSDGEYKHQYGEGATQADLVGLETIAFGDLDGDGLDDAAVILWWQSGGSGTFKYLAAVLDDDGAPRQAGIEPLGDRVKIESLSVSEGQILLESITHGPDDPMCCPTQKAALTYRFGGEQLVKVLEETTDAEAPVALEGTQWTLVSYVNSQGETVYVLPGTEITTKSTADQIAGGAGCNNYFASYQVEGNNLTIGQIGSTVMACEPEVNEQETQYLAALKSVASYQVADDQLQMMNVDGETVLTFSVLEPTPLTGTTWRLSGYNNGKGGIVSVLSGTEITAVFGDDGSLVGSAGCNNFTASYEVEGENLSVSPAAVTRMMCAEPEGIMAQERDYLAALESVTGYQVEGDTLALMDADGTPIATFTQAGGPDIVGVVWKWERFNDTAGRDDVVVDASAKYTLRLLPDGTYQVQADCNLSSGGYTLKGNKLTLAPGPTTLAECEPGSLYDEYLAWLGEVATFVLDGDRLVLNLKADVGNLIFAPAGDVAAAADIVDVEWHWSELVETAPAAQSVVPDPENYTLVFRPDGTFALKADCNVGSGTHVLEGSHISFELGPLTRAACTPSTR